MSKGTGRARRATKVQKADELGGEVTLRAHIDQAGLTVSGKSRFLAATDRLLGGLSGIPAAYFEGIRDRMEIKNRIRSEQLRTQARVWVRLLESVDETGRAAARRFIAEEVRKQINREAVWVETDKAIRTLPPPDSTEPQSEHMEIEEDWINIFASYAEKASSERLQQLWGRILAGEIRKPGSFAPSTLRVISEMDADIATAFQEVAALRFGDNALLKPQAMQNELLFRWAFLEEVGLLQEVSGNLAIQHAGSPGQGAAITTRDFYLKITFKENARNTSVPIVKITRAGMQIADILPWDEQGALRGVAERLSGLGVGLELGRIIGRTPGGVMSAVLEIIKP